MPLDWSMPMVSARDGEVGSGGSLTEVVEVGVWISGGGTGD